MIKCLVIHSSYRRGNTYKVTQLVQSCMQENENVVFEEIFLSELNLPFCMGCNQCFLKDKAHCPHSSIIQPIAEKISQCDALIITTPTYSLQVPGVLKCWIDHMSYYFHRPQFFTKKALVISTTAGAGAKSTASYVGRVLEYWGFNHITLLPMRCFSFDYVPAPKELKQIHLVADRFYKEITHKPLHGPSFKRIFLYNLWRSMAMSGEENNTADFQYWERMNLLYKSYPDDIPLGPMKQAWAAFSYAFSRKILK